MRYLIVGLFFLASGCQVSSTSEQIKETASSNFNSTPLPDLGPEEYRFISFSEIEENTNSQRKSVVAGAINWTLLTPILDEASTNLESDLVAVFGALTDEGFYIHHEQILGFSTAAMEQANGNTRSYFYEFGILDNEQELVQRVAIAYIPDSELAKNELTKWLSPLTPDETDSLLAKQLPDDTESFTCYTCFFDSPQDLKLIAPSLASTGELTCVITFCDGTEATVTASSLEGDYSVNVDFNWIISGGGSSSSSGGGSTSGDGSSSSSCPPPFVCGNPDQAPDQGDSQEEEEQNQVIPQPCEGDPVPNPEIAPQTNSGTKGGMFGKTRTDANGNPKDHFGVDLVSPFGAPIYAMYDGFSTIATQFDDITGEVTGSGHQVSITSTVNGNTVRIVYFHLQNENRASGTVKAGDIIGYQGDSGNLKNAIDQNLAVSHLHIKVVENGATVDPLQYLNTKIDPNTGEVTETCSGS